MGLKFINRVCILGIMKMMVVAAVAVRIIVRIVLVVIIGDKVEVGKVVGTEDDVYLHK